MGHERLSVARTPFPVCTTFVQHLSMRAPEMVLPPEMQKVRGRGDGFERMQGQEKMTQRRKEEVDLTHRMALCALVCTLHDSGPNTWKQMSRTGQEGLPPDGCFLFSQ
eukprot:RCo053482